MAKVSWTLKHTDWFIASRFKKNNLGAVAHPLDGSLFFCILIALKTKEIHNRFIKVLNEKFNGDVVLLLDDLERFAIENGEQYEIADKILKLKDKWK